MTAEAAVYNFFKSFGIDAYPDTAVPDDAAFPYMTYSSAKNPFGSTGVSITVHIWYYTESEAAPTAKAEQLLDALKDGGKTIPCDDGMIWLQPGSPWCQSIVDSQDRNIKGRYINITRIDFRV